MNDATHSQSESQAIPDPGVILGEPDISLTQLSFADTTVPALQQWVSVLPLVNVPETAKRMSMAVSELAMLNAPCEEKFDLIESVRPIVHYVATRLNRLSLNKAGHDDGELTHQLSVNLYNSYAGALAEALESRAEDEKSIPRHLLIGLVHRLMADLSRVLLHCLQFYRTPPPNLWAQFTWLYRTARELDLLREKFSDDENTTTEPLTVEQCFMRALLLQTARPNQLSPQQLANLFNALEHWRDVASLDAGGEQTMLLIDVAGKRPPMPRRLFRRGVEPMGIHTEVIAYELDAYLKGVDGNLVIPPAVDTTLLRHLVDAWSISRSRAFRREPSGAGLRVCVGLKAIHYFLSGATEFADQISKPDALLRREVNPFLELDYETEAKPQAAASSYSHYDTEAVDTSPEGYRLHWLDTLPDNVRVGEVVAVREEGNTRWSIGIVRWIQQGEANLRRPAADSEAQMSQTDPQDTHAQDAHQVITGLQLLAPRAIPVAVRAILKTGGHMAFARGLMLPALDAIRQPATLLTPSVPFSAGQKVQIQRQGLQTTGQLMQRTLMSESVNQFTFRMLDGYLENVRSDSTIDGLSAMTREDTTQGP